MDPDERLGIGELAVENRSALTVGFASGTVTLLRSNRGEAVVDRPPNVVNEGEAPEREASE
jgi:hypothetical protein